MDEFQTWKNGGYNVLQHVDCISILCHPASIITYQYHTTVSFQKMGECCGDHPDDGMYTAFMPVCLNCAVYSWKPVSWLCGTSIVSSSIFLFSVYKYFPLGSKQVVLLGQGAKSLWQQLHQGGVGQATVEVQQVQDGPLLWT